MKKVYVVGTGIITCLGKGWDETFTSLSQSQSGLSRLQFPDNTSIAAGVVPYTDEELAHQAGCVATLPRAALLGTHAIKEAYLQSGIQHMEQWRVGTVSGCMFGGMDRTSEFYSQFKENISKGKLRDIVAHTPGSITEIIAKAVSATEFFTTITTGSSSGLNALISAARLIALDQLDVVFAGGTESLTQYLISGLKSEGLIDPEPCRPFDASCNGLNPGEGAAYLVLVSERVVERERLNVLSVLSGFGNSNIINNGYPSRIKEEAAVQSMKEAIAKAGLTTNAICYINLFGTGVADFDLIESAAIVELLGAQLPPMSSTKSLTGYTSGASGAIESVIALMSIVNHCVFKSTGFETPIPEVGIQPQRYFEARKIDHVLVNSFSLLGNCASVVFSKTST